MEDTRCVIYREYGLICEGFFDLNLGLQMD